MANIFFVIFGLYFASAFAAMGFTIVMIVATLAGLR